MNATLLYRIAAAHAFLLASPMLLFSLLGVQTPLHTFFYASETLQCIESDPSCTLFMRMAMGGVLLISYCYWLIAKDLSRTDLIWVGIVAKTLVFASFLNFYMTGVGSLAFLAVGVTDLILAGLFLLELQLRD